MPFAQMGGLRRKPIRQAPTAPATPAAPTMPTGTKQRPPDGGGSTGSAPTPGRQTATPPASNPAAPWQSAVDLYTQDAQPAFDALALQAQQAQHQNQWNQQGYDIDRQNAQNNYNTGMQNLELDSQGNVIDAAAARRQQEYYRQMYGVDVSRFNNNDAWMAGNQVFADGRFQIAGGERALGDQTYDIAGDRYGLAGDRYGLQGKTHESVLRQLAIQAAMAQRGAVEGRRDAALQAVAGGAATSAGHRWARDDIASALGFKLSDIGEQTTQENVNREQQGLDYQGAGLDYRQAGVAHQQSELDYQKEAISYMSQTSDIQHDRNNLAYDLVESGLTSQEQQARLQDRLQTLDLQAQRIGISRQELQNRLTTGLAQLGLSSQISAGQLTDMMNSNNQQYMALVMQILRAGTTVAPYAPT